MTCVSDVHIFLSVHNNNLSYRNGLKFCFNFYLLWSTADPLRGKGFRKQETRSETQFYFDHE
ncbi:hypothetical protein ZEAMMB73_Zm00001d007634 [Zea mays]|uniref:Uncharacterized protein n=1 Tax=Zea mays TaxID=4577 RepID=A0A1D6F7P9_MAIZE|nr:hypothetical protein ZEAMMB73_Zm00001d007634 [Zea mays]